MHSAQPAVEGAIEQRVAERYGEWFPGRELSGPPRLEVLSSRHSCRLYLLRPPDAAAPGVLAKTRLEVPPRRDPPTRAGRPTLSSRPLGPTEQAQLEYASLATLYGAIGDSDARFGAVRPLDLLAAQNTVLMEFVTGAETLRQFLIRQSRLLPGRRREAADVWQRVGGWLRLFQETTSSDQLPVRQGRRHEVEEQFRAYQEFLSPRVGAATFRDLGTRGADLAAAVLPDPMPSAAGHGDFAPRNMFLGPQGRLTVFDPLPRWAAPAQDDLSRFLVGVRLLGLQLHTRGAAFSPAQLERWEREVISGYYAGRPVPTAQLRCYQALIMMDKWSALVDPAGAGWATRAKRASVVLASRYLAAQVRQLLDLAEQGTDRSGLR